MTHARTQRAGCVIRHARARTHPCARHDRTGRGLGAQVLLRELHAVGQAAAAARIHQDCGFDCEPPFAPAVLAEAGGAAEAGADEFLRMDDVPIAFVDSEPALVACTALLAAAPVVSLDAEWKPGDASRAAIVQLATPTHCFVLDLIGLSATCAPALDSCLARVLAGGTERVVVGLGVADDFAKLRRSYPMLSCFSRATRVLDLGRLARRAASAMPAASLSALCARYLGKPLDKTVRPHAHAHARMRE